jgi:hypothetical protein
MQSKIEKEVRFLKVYAVVATIGFAAFIVSGFTMKGAQTKFDEIDVGRINIVEKSGKLDMVISNQERQHPGISNGKVIERSGPRPPGMIFFDQTGDEMGGLIFGDNGGRGHFGSLTFDKVLNDQAVGFRYLESDNGTYESGLQLWQPPNISSAEVNAKVAEVRKIADPAQRKAAFQALIDKGQLTVNRMFLGKQRDNSIMLEMDDAKNRPRIRMLVAPDGTPKLEFLDDGGKVIYSLPK